MPFIPTDTPERVVPRGVLEGTGTRAFLHNLAANPDVAKSYMASLGNQIRSYGSGWNWAWRNKDGDPWIPAASQGFGEFLLNHIADVVIGVGTGITATVAAGFTAETGPGALVAGAASGAAASGGLETARQGLGSILGIPNNVSAPEIAGATLGGAIAEPLGAAGGVAIRGTGRLLGMGVRKVGNLVPEIAAKVADIEALGASGQAGRTAGAVLMEGSRLTRGGSVPLIDPDRAGGLLRAAVRFVNRVGIPEVKAADAKVLSSGVEFDLSRAIRTIEDRTLELGRTARVRTELASAPTLRKDAAQLLERLTAETGFSGDWSKVPGGIAMNVRRALQNEASGKGAYAGAGPSKIYGQMVKRAAARTRAAIESGMESVDPEFSKLMKTASEKLTVLDFVNKHLKMADRGEGGRQAASAYIRGIYGENKIAYLRAIHDLDRHFSTGLRSKLVDRAIIAVRQANIGKAIGNRGLAEMLPRITSGGHVRTAAALLPVGGFLAGGPIGAVAGGVLASPRLIMRAAGPVSAAGRAVEGATSALARVHLGGASRVVATGTLDTAGVTLMREAIRREGGGSKPVARQEDGTRPRRRIYVGR